MWPSIRRATSVPIATVALILSFASLEAQFVIDEVVITAGASAEGYQGNLPSVGIVRRDSTEFASAAIGEMAVRADASYRTASNGAIVLGFDGGLRQFIADGFELQDYAPRELVATFDLAYQRTIGSRVGIRVGSQLRGRQVDDRPPMPLFLQPGFRAGDLSVAVSVRGPRDVVYDLSGAWGGSDFLAPRFAPQVALLNRQALRGELGATLSGGGGSQVRLFGGGERSHYPKQTTFDESEPTRRDVTVHTGVSWTYQSDYLIQATLEGRLNRSNSNRPEYDAITFRALFNTSLPRGVALSLYGALTAKQYIHESQFARLLPGEEANNASFAYVEVARNLAQNLDGTVRVGWTRAETEIGGAYFERFGGSFYFNFRPDF